MAVHTELGPGLLESTYQHCLLHELQQRGLSVESQKSLPILYKGVRLDPIDLLVEGEVIVEPKSVSRVEPIHEAQLLS
jgi:GxxExxY protein